MCRPFSSSALIDFFQTGANSGCPCGPQGRPAGWGAAQLTSFLICHRGISLLPLYSRKALGSSGGQHISGTGDLGEAPHSLCHLAGEGKPMWAPVSPGSVPSQSQVGLTAWTCTPIRVCRTRGCLFLLYGTTWVMDVAGSEGSPRPGRGCRWTSPPPPSDLIQEGEALIGALESRGWGLCPKWGNLVGGLCSALWTV